MDAEQLLRAKHKKSKRNPREGSNLAGTARRSGKRSSKGSSHCHGESSRRSERSPGEASDSESGLSSSSGSESEQEEGASPFLRKDLADKLPALLPCITAPMTPQNSENSMASNDRYSRRHTLISLPAAVSPNAAMSVKQSSRRMSFDNHPRIAVDTSTLTSPSSRVSVRLTSSGDSSGNLVVPQVIPQISPKAEDVLHNGRLVPLSRASVVMHMPVVVEHNTAQELEAQVSMSGPVRRASMAAASTKRAQRATRTSTCLTVTQSHEVSVAAALAGKEVGHRLLRSEIPDEMIDTVEKLMDSQTKINVPSFARQTVHSLIHAASVHLPHVSAMSTSK